MKRTSQARRPFWSAAILTLVFGCATRGPDERPADPTLARQALRTSLDAWKNGETADTLHHRQPPIRIEDEDYLIGSHLESYQVNDSVKEIGNTLAYPVILKLTDRRGRPRKKAVIYCVATHPFLSVARQEMP